jgi:hypothetical protein
MTRWLLLLGGLLVWAGQFFALYAFASIYPGNPLAGSLAIAATCFALAADAAIIWMAVVFRLRSAKDSFDAWVSEIAFVGGLVSFLAVLWQGLPALI